MNAFELSPKTTILIIDDQANNLALLVDYLEGLDFDIVVSESGESGLARAAFVQPALIILDVLMPGIDGFETCKLLKLNQQTQNIPVIFMTALSAVTDIVKGFEAGGIDYITKPIQLEEARARIETHLTIAKLQEELHQREAHYRSIVNTVSDSLFVLNQEGLIIDINPAALATYGYEREELVGQPLSKLISPEYIPLFEQYQKNLSTPDVFPGECINLLKDGSRINVEVRNAAIESEGNLFWVAAARDVSQRKQLEQEMLKIKKLEAMATLTGGMAHDFNNLLSIILGHIEIALGRLQNNSQLVNNLGHAKEAAIQAANLAKQFLTFSSRGAPIKKTCSLGSLLSDSAKLIFSESLIRCEYAISDELWPCSVDADQIKQVFSCVFNNAKDAMSNNGRVKISAENLETTSLQTGYVLPLLEGKQIKITIEDQGIGIAAKYLSRVFDPYFSTKEMGNIKGQGLGLSIAHAIIRQHGGIIQLESQQGMGTKVFIYLAVADQ